MINPVGSTKQIEIEQINHNTADHLHIQTQVDRPVRSTALQDRVLREIAGGRASDFPDHLFWAQWCREMAGAALRGNTHDVDRLVEGRDFRRQR